MEQTNKRVRRVEGGGEARWPIRLMLLSEKINQRHEIPGLPRYQVFNYTGAAIFCLAFVLALLEQMLEEQNSTRGHGFNSHWVLGFFFSFYTSDVCP